MVIWVPLVRDWTTIGLEGFSGTSAIIVAWLGLVTENPLRFVARILKLREKPVIPGGKSDTVKVCCL